MQKSLWRWRLAVIACASAGPTALAAQDASRPNSPPIATAARIIQPPVIDGRLDEAVWASASAIQDFVQREPFDASPVSEQTVVRVLYDANALYIGAWLFDADADAIVLGETRRDAELSNSDAFRILLDTYLDRQNAFVFGTTPAGIEYDGQVTREGQGGFTGQVRQQSGSGGGFNINWDGSWTVATTRDSAGWYAEFRIPFSTLRYQRSGAQRWGLNFARHIRRRNEEAIWSPIPRQFDFHRVSMAGLLEGVDAPARLPLSLTPYVLGSGRRDYTRPVATSTNFEIGGDAKLGLTQSLTLDLTVNTDFAQVEVDEQQINLTRFNLFFPEKRPFFLENAGTFAVGSPQEVELFFSRRIGIDENRRAVPIVGGGRLTGRVAGLNIGLLNLQTDQPNNYGALRVLRELGNRTRVGGIIVTRVNTDSTADHNISAAIDGRLGLGPSFTLDGYVARTDRRADAGDVAGGISASFNSRWWDFGGTFRQVGENFSPDVGFVSRTGYAFRSARVLRRIRPASVPWLRELRPHMSYREHLDLDGFTETRLIHLDSHFEFPNGAFFQLPAINFTREGLKQPFRIAPGVVVPPGTYDNFEWGFDYHTNRSARFSVDGRIDIGGFYSGHRAGGETLVSARFSEAFVAGVRSTYYRVWLKEGNFRTHVLGVRSAYSFSPRMYLQALLQYNQQTESFSSNLRFGWLGTAGTGLYIVYNDIETTGIAERWARPIDRTLIVKFTRQFDLTR